jgi:EAL domain-containing protein (putative c-di-GMP-specific phosphodiesterase class I)
MVGLEALLRWNHPERGRIAPDRFIPLAEDSGQIVPIGAWVLEQARAQGVRWQRAGAPTLRMSVNMSPVQFRQPDLAAAIGDVLARTGLAAEHLELEITERLLMQDTEANLDTLRRIKDLGVRISIDDFGLGHSSLHYLRRFPFDEIKVDRSFIGALEHDPSQPPVHAREVDAMIQAAASSLHPSEPKRVARKPDSASGRQSQVKSSLKKST